MAVSKKAQKGAQWLKKRAVAILDNILKDGLWKRMIKNIFGVTLTIVLCLVRPVSDTWGKTAYLAPIAMLFGNPGRRLGVVVESLALIILGCIIAVPWSVFGVWLGSLALKHNVQAGFTVRALCFGLTAITHGYLRSRTPRLFIFTVFLILIAGGAFASEALRVTKTLVTQNCYPILCAVGLSLIINISIFPQFSSDFIGHKTISLLNETKQCLQDAESYFVRTSMDEGSHELARNKDEIESQNTPQDTKLRLGSRNNNIKLSSSTKITQYLQSLVKGLGLDEDASKSKAIKLENLTSSKKKLRKTLALCKSAQAECQFELAYSHLSPIHLKEISVVEMGRLVNCTLAVIGACESKFALIGDELKPDDPVSVTAEQEIDVVNGQDMTDLDTTDAEAPKQDSDTKKKAKSKQTRRKEMKIKDFDPKLVRPMKEIEFGDAQLLRFLVRRISKPLKELREVMDRAFDVISCSIAYAYDVEDPSPRLRRPKGVLIEEIDVYLELLSSALSNFDKRSASALKGATIIIEMKSHEVDIMPREEVFLISSFIVNLRQAGARLFTMLEHARGLVDRRNKRGHYRRLYLPEIQWRKWLFSGGADDESLPVAGRKPARKGTGDDEDDLKSSQTSVSRNAKVGLRKRLPFSKRTAKGRQKDPEADQSPPAESKISDEIQHANEQSLFIRLRGVMADIMDWILNSEDLLYAFKLTVAAYILSFPAFVPQWNSWYSLNRGIWAVFQLVYVTEVSIGTTVMTFFIRAIGTIAGCLIGYAAYAARSGDPYVATVIACIGIVPLVYIQVGTKYPKVGQVGMVSLSVILLATVLVTVPGLFVQNIIACVSELTVEGTATQNFLRRTIAFIIGSVVALVVEIVFMPVKARSRMVESICTAIEFVANMEACIAHGIEDPDSFDVKSAEELSRYKRAAEKAKAALAAAETFLPFTTVEPRIKGNFKPHAKIYEEIIFVLRQIVERMDNMIALRNSLGSEVLEEFNPLLRSYRRDIASSVTLTLFAVREGLATKTSLPQFFPSARLAHLRMINKIRELVHSKAEADGGQTPVTQVARNRAVRRKFLSWNAASAALVEILEYLEELITLVKMLIGANEFRIGMLKRSSYRGYMELLSSVDAPAETSGETEKQRHTNLQLRDRSGSNQKRKEDGAQVPESLQRIQSRRQDEKLERKRTNTHEETNSTSAELSSAAKGAI